MYVRSKDGRLFVAPLGSEYLGLSSTGQPMVFYRNGWIGPMVEIVAGKLAITDPEEFA